MTDSFPNRDDALATLATIDTPAAALLRAALAMPGIVARPGGMIIYTLVEHARPDGGACVNLVLHEYMPDPTQGVETSP